MPVERESDLYAPVKAYLESLGFAVRGEVCKCDMAAVRDDLLVAVELKLSFGLPVLYQAIDRLAAADLAYVAVAVPDGRKARANWDAQVPAATRLCRMLGIGLIAVRDGRACVVADPAPYQPRRSPKRRARMLGEFTRRSGDHNLGGTTRRPRVTAYREEALRLAAALAAAGSDMAARDVRAATGVARAATIMRDDVYGWFERTGRGRYAVTPPGRDALALYADVLAAQRAAA